MNSKFHYSEDEKSGSFDWSLVDDVGTLVEEGLTEQEMSEKLDLRVEDVRMLIFAYQKEHQN